MGVLARCRECKNSVGGVIISEHSCCLPEYICENCMDEDYRKHREDPEMGESECEVCYVVSKLINSRHEKCGHKNPYTNWCNRCREIPACHYNVGRKGYDGTNDVCDDCFKRDFDEKTNTLRLFTKVEDK